MDKPVNYKHEECGRPVYVLFCVNDNTWEGDGLPCVGCFGTNVLIFGYSRSHVALVACRFVFAASHWQYSHPAAELTEEDTRSVIKHVSGARDDD